MARSISTRSSSRSSGRKSPARKRKNAKKGSLWEQIQIFTARRLLDAVALLLLGGGLFILLSLLSYQAGDPSWNTSVSDGANIANWGGGGGAWLADILMQTIGFGALTLAIGLGAWGIKLFNRQSIRPFFFRLSALLISAVFLSVALAQIPAGNFLLHPYLGSTAGTILMQNAADLGQSISPLIGPALIAALAGFMAAVTLFFGAAFTRDELATMLHKSFNLIAAIFYAIYTLMMRFIDWVKHYNDPDYAPPQKPLFKFDMFKAPAPKPRKAAPVIQEDEALPTPAPEPVT